MRDPAQSYDMNVVATATQSIEPGPFHVALRLPPDAGQYTVRAFIAGQSEFAMGARTVALHSTNVPLAAHVPDGGAARK
jgi:hypothetical protein